MYPPTPAPPFIPPAIAAEQAALRVGKLRALSDRLGWMFQSLRDAVANIAQRDRTPGLLVMLVVNTLSRHFRIINEYLVKYRDGTLRRPRTPRATPAAYGPPKPRRRPDRPEHPLPRGRQWLVRRFPGQCGFHFIHQVSGDHLRLLLQQQDMQDFLAACPQARRPLRALWWALYREPMPDCIGGSAPTRPRAIKSPKPPRPSRRVRRKPRAENPIELRLFPPTPAFATNFSKT